MTPSPNRTPPRWWPVALITALTASVMLWIWLRQAPDRQGRVLQTLTLAVVALLLLLVWWLFFSRIRWRTRFLGLGLLAVVGALGAASLRIRGTSGDVLPELVWRWSAEPGGGSDLPEPGRLPAGGRTVSERDYPQFLGPNGDGVVRDAGLARDWSGREPRILWKQPIGAGLSGFAVAGDFAVTQEQRGEEEWVTGYDLRSGALLWYHADRVRHEEPFGGAGPRATPAIRDGRVFTIGATGLLNALDLVSGNRSWSRDTLADSGAPMLEYGVSASPRVVGTTVVVGAGGPDGRSLLAYDCATGELVWSAGDHGPAYSSPQPVQLAGRTQLLVFNAGGLAGHDPDGGAVLWEQPWPDATQRVSQPVVLPGDRVFLSTGYGVGGKLFAVVPDGSGAYAVETLWESRALKAKFTNVVHRDGHLYGLDDGILACIGVDDGKRRWKGGRYGHGQLIRADDLLLVQTENGDIAMVEAQPDAFHELGRTDVLEGKTWNHPALAGRLMLVRNDRQAACVELPGKGGG